LTAERSTVDRENETAQEDGKAGTHQKKRKEKKKFGNKNLLFFPSRMAPQSHQALQPVWAYLASDGSKN
jgi:hypothetical protein